MINQHLITEKRGVHCRNYSTGAWYFYSSQIENYCRKLGNSSDNRRSNGNWFSGLNKFAWRLAVIKQGLWLSDFLLRYLRLIPQAYSPLATDMLMTELQLMTHPVTSHNATLHRQGFLECLWQNRLSFISTNERVNLPAPTTLSALVALSFVFMHLIAVRSIYTSDDDISVYYSCHKIIDIKIPIPPVPMALLTERASYSWVVGTWSILGQVTT